MAIRALIKLCVECNNPFYILIFCYDNFLTQYSWNLFVQCFPHFLVCWYTICRIYNLITYNYWIIKKYVLNTYDSCKQRCYNSKYNCFYTHTRCYRFKCFNIYIFCFTGNTFFFLDKSATVLQLPLHLFWLIMKR